MTVILPLEGVELEAQKFEAILDYTASLKPTWAYLKKDTPPHFLTNWG